MTRTHPNPAEPSKKIWNLNRLVRSVVPISLISLILALGSLSACTSSPAYTPLLSAEPAQGAELNRAPRTLRLFFNALPDVERSSLRLIGPNGEHQLRGLHTMAADDLMIEILDAVTPGGYTVEWQTVVADDPSQYSGSYQFTYSE